MASYAEITEGIAPDDHIPLIREMMVYDALCPHSVNIIRNELGVFGLKMQPSPLHWSRQTEWPWAIKQANLRPWHVCLDIGGSWSVFKFAVARRAKGVVSLDLDQEAVEKGLDTTKRLGFKNIRQVQGDCRKLPFADKSFDHVFCLSVLEHVPDGHLDAIKEFQRVLKPGGVLLATFDLVTEGKGSDNFYMDNVDGSAILKHLHLPTVPGMKKVVGARMKKEGVVILVMFLRWEKPRILPNVDLQF